MKGVWQRLGWQRKSQSWKLEYITNECPPVDRNRHSNIKKSKDKLNSKIKQQTWPWSFLEIFGESWLGIHLHRRIVVRFLGLRSSHLSSREGVPTTTDAYKKWHSAPCRIWIVTKKTDSFRVIDKVISEKVKSKYNIIKTQETCTLGKLDRTCTVGKSWWHIIEH